MDALFVSGAARELGVRPRDISDLFYGRVVPLDDTQCPIVGCRRIIPRVYLPIIADALRAKGRIRDIEPVAV